MASNSESASTLNKRRRNVITLKDKLDIIAAIKNGEARADLAEKYDIGLSTVSDIFKREDEFREFADFADTSRRIMKKAAHEEVEEAVYMWYQLMRSAGNAVTGPQLCEKALMFSRKMNLDRPFKASSGWLQRFKIRRGVTFGNTQKKGEGSEADPVASSTTPMPDDDEIIQRCLVAIKTEELRTDADDCRQADDTRDAFLNSSTGFIQRKKRRKRIIHKTRKQPTTVSPNNNLEDMKKRKLALEIEQLELRNHLCRIEIFQAERQHFLAPSSYTSSFYTNAIHPPITEVYLDNSIDASH